MQILPVQAGNGASSAWIAALASQDGGGEPPSLNQDPTALLAAVEARTSEAILKLGADPESRRANLQARERARDERLAEVEARARAARAEARARQREREARAAQAEAESQDRARLAYTASELRELYEQAVRLNLQA